MIIIIIQYYFTASIKVVMNILSVHYFSQIAVLKVLPVSSKCCASIEGHYWVKYLMKSAATINTFCK